MLIKPLVEDHTRKKYLLAQHGLSLYIETNNHKILFDLGNDQTFLKNAKAMGIDLNEIDTVVISHGHNDHIGGLDAFLEVNHHAKIYMSEYAFKSHLKKTGEVLRDIGGQRPKDESQLVFVKDLMWIGEQTCLIPSEQMKDQIIKDTHLFSKTPDGLAEDAFEDELYCLIKEQDKHVLFSGCSHKGIEGIIHLVEQKMDTSLSAVIGGFHFSHYNPLKKEEFAYLETLGKSFYASKIQHFVACHCTGDKAFDDLKATMKEKLQDFQVGDCLIL